MPILVPPTISGVPEYGIGAPHTVAPMAHGTGRWLHRGGGNRGLSYETLQNAPPKIQQYPQEDPGIRGD